MTHPPNPLHVQKFLADVDYPKTKDELVRTAEDSGADDETRRALRILPDRTYDGPAAVSAEVSRGS
ncbi:MAG: DUF2795 domain-containing protein [Pseudonocardiaceae bacterium]|nr:DUF2795 domain-containing protein [Pseudonocardiaceae bacterium]